VCTDKPAKPDLDAMKALLAACFPDKPLGLKKQGEPKTDEKEKGNYETDKPRRCSIPPALLISHKACLIKYNGSDIEKPCHGGGDAKCNANSSCTVNIAGKDAELYFCEPPESPVEGPKSPRGRPDERPESPAESPESPRSLPDGRPDGRPGGHPGGRPGGRPSGLHDGRLKDPRDAPQPRTVGKEAGEKVVMFSLTG